MLPADLGDAERAYRERVSELLGLNFQNLDMVDEVVRNIITDKRSVNRFGEEEPSFIDLLKRDSVGYVKELFSLECAISGHASAKEITTDFKRRTGEWIVDRLYRQVRSVLNLKAYEQVDKEFAGLKDKRRRHEETVSNVRKSKSERRRAKLAAVYAFEEERMQFEDDVAFSEFATAQHFKRHIQSILIRCYPRFNLEDAVEMACALMVSGRMKGKNFRKPKCAT